MERKNQEKVIQTKKRTKGAFPVEVAREGHQRCDTDEEVWQRWEVVNCKLRNLMAEDC